MRLRSLCGAICSPAHGVLACMLTMANTTDAMQALPTRAVSVAFTVGADGGNDLTRSAFGSVGAAGIGADGSIYVIDSGECRVKHFSSTGAFIRSFGRSGAGPGEFGDCRTLRMSVTDDSVNVTDASQNRVVLFAPDGRLRDTRTLPPFPGDMGVIRSSPLRHGYGLRTESGTMTPDGQRRFTGVSYLVMRQLGTARVDTIARYRQDAVFIELSNGRGTTAPTGLGYAGAWTVCGDSVAVFADGYTGAVTWHAISPEGLRVARTANVGRRGEAVSASERRALAEKVRASPRVLEDARRFGGGGIRSVSEPPNMSSVLWTVRCTADGALWVGMQQRSGERTEWTVLPLRGDAFTVRLPADFYFLNARNDRIVGRSTTADDIPVMRVLRIAR